MTTLELEIENARLRQALKRIDKWLNIPAAEYVPAIPECWDIIKDALSASSSTPLADAYKRLRDESQEFMDQMVGMYSSGAGTKIFDLEKALAEITKLEGGEAEVSDHKEPLDHPCRGVCSGWKQGYERGLANTQDNLTADAAEDHAHTT